MSYSDRHRVQIRASGGDLKQRLKEEGNETVTNCHGLKMKAADGKMRLTDVADAPLQSPPIQTTLTFSAI